MDLGEVQVTDDIIKKVEPIVDVEEVTKVIKIIEIYFEEVVKDEKILNVVSVEVVEEDIPFKSNIRHMDQEDN